MRKTNRPPVGKRPLTLMLLAVISWAIHAPGFAQQDATDDISIVFPAKSVEEFIGKLLPYEIDLGKGFSGLFLVKSINNIKVLGDKVAFSSHIHGENVEFKTKIGNQEAVLSFGNINLQNRWEVSYRYDEKDQILYIKPHLIDPKTEKSSSQGELLLTALFGGLSDIEHPVDLKELPPMTTRLMDKHLTVKFDVTEIRTANNQVIVRIKPIPKMGPVEK